MAFRRVFFGKEAEKKTNAGLKKSISVKKIENVGDENICS